MSCPGCGLPESKRPAQVDLPYQLQMVASEIFISRGFVVAGSLAGGAALGATTSRSITKLILIGRPKYSEASSWKRSENVFLIQSNLNLLGAPTVSEWSLSSKDTRVNGWIQVLNCWGDSSRERVLMAASQKPKGLIEFKARGLCRLLIFLENPL